MEIEPVRTFIAIEFPSELKERLRLFQDSLKNPDDHFVKWVEPDLMHLTLKFLGNQHPQKLEIISEALGKAISDKHAFSLSTGQTGCFPGWNRARIYWLGLAGDLRQFLILHNVIEETLARAGFPSENRDFTAHLTLARIKEGNSQQDIAGFTARIRNIQFKPVHSIVVDRISMMKSTLTRQGPIYERISEHFFKG